MAGVLALAGLLASCVGSPQPVPAATASPPPALASEIRYGVVGQATDVNVWALFDEQGASYANLALRSQYWPRLYGLSVPHGEVIPLAARQSTTVSQTGELFTGLVTLRDDLRWTDGARLRAQDVAFTVNTALAFELGLDWKAYYDSEALSGAQAHDDATVEFTFRLPPDVGRWQYGALQGPIVQENFWAPRVRSAAALLPDDALRASLPAAELHRAALEIEVAELNTRLLAVQHSGKQDRDLEMAVRRRQGDLDAANNRLAELADEYASKLAAARNALFQVADQGEPTLGAWLPASSSKGVWSNSVNPDFPFGRPVFTGASYRFYGDEASALRGLALGEIDVVLAEGGISSEGRGQLEDDASITQESHPGQGMRFLVFNLMTPPLAQPELRRALACLLDGDALSSPFLAEQGLATQAFVPGDDWDAPGAVRPCAEFDGPQRRIEAVEILRSAGYSWSTEPTRQAGGHGLQLPDGEMFPSLTLLAPASDPVRAELAGLIQDALVQVGIPVAVGLVDAEDITYAVFSSRRFDLALVGWRVSAYPGYLCEWFGPHGHFNYGNAALEAECDALGRESDTEQARRRVDNIQAILRADVPFVPVYAQSIHEAYRRVRFPFAHVAGGLSGLYGAPSLASPRPDQ